MTVTSKYRERNSKGQFITNRRARQVELFSGTLHVILNEFKLGNRLNAITLLNDAHLRPIDIVECVLERSLTPSEVCMYLNAMSGIPGTESRKAFGHGKVWQDIRQLARKVLQLAKAEEEIRNNPALPDMVVVDLIETRFMELVNSLGGFDTVPDTWDKRESPGKSTRGSLRPEHPVGLPGDTIPPYPYQAIILGLLP